MTLPEAEFASHYGDADKWLQHKHVTAVYHTQFSPLLRAATKLGCCCHVVRGARQNVACACAVALLWVGPVGCAGRARSIPRRAALLGAKCIRVVYTRVRAPPPRVPRPNMLCVRARLCGLGV